MKSKFKITLVLALISIILTSCGGVPEEKVATSENAFSVAEVLEMVATENDVTRTLYTKAIVGGGKKQGMKIGEKMM